MRRPKSVTKEGERYGTPKQYQSRYYKTARPGGNRRYPCKKLKGEHDFQIKKQEKSRWFDPDKWWTTYVCTGCGKKKIRWEVQSETTKS